MNAKMERLAKLTSFDIWKMKSGSAEEYAKARKVCTEILNSYFKPLYYFLILMIAAASTYYYFHHITWIAVTTIAIFLLAYHSVSKREGIKEGYMYGFEYGLETGVNKALDIDDKESDDIATEAIESQIH